MRLFVLLIGITLLMPFFSYAEPSVLEINSKIKKKSYDRYINAVHKEIDVYGKSLAAIKYGILDGMLRTKGYRWALEGEGDGFILARFDYRGDTNIMRIEYNDSFVQLKYHQAWGDYQCKKLIDDICYKNARGYYNYIKNLRSSIARQINVL